MITSLSTNLQNKPITTYDIKTAPTKKVVNLRRKHNLYAQPIASPFFRKKEPDQPLPHGRQPVEQGNLSESLRAPKEIEYPEWYETGMEPRSWAGLEFHDDEGQECMRRVGQLVRQVFDHISDKVTMGSTTDSLDKLAHEYIIENGGYPSLLNCDGYPKSISTSINEVASFGIPDDRQLVDGDIVNIYIAVYFAGYHACASRMYCIGSPNEEAAKLCEVSKQITELAISLCEPALQYQGIGAAIQTLADQNNYHILKEIVGHGIGTRYHAEPIINHAKNDRRGVIVPYQTFTVGPVLAEQECELEIWRDKWTTVTSNFCLSAQWMDTVLITEDGYEVLT